MPDENQLGQDDANAEQDSAPAPDEAPTEPIPVEQWIPHPPTDWVDQWVLPAYAGKVYGADKKQEREDEAAGKSPPPEK